MKLTIEQIIRVRFIMQYNGVNAEGNPIPRVFSNEEFSAFRWFWKNTGDVLAKYQELLAQKKDQITKELSAKDSKPDNSAILNKLEEDEELIKAFKETYHDIEVQTKTNKLLKKIFSSAELTHQDLIIADIIEQYSNV